MNIMWGGGWNIKHVLGNFKLLDWEGYLTFFLYWCSGWLLSTILPNTSSLLNSTCSAYLGVVRTQVRNKKEYNRIIEYNNTWVNNRCRYSLSCGRFSKPLGISDLPFLKITIQKLYLLVERQLLMLWVFLCLPCRTVNAPLLGSTSRPVHPSLV